MIASALTRAEIMGALRARHVYASADRNLQVIARVNGRLIGDIVTAVPPLGSALDVRLTLHDPDEPNARYQVQVLSDRRPGGAPASVVKTITFQGDTQDRAILGVNFRGSGQYLLLAIRQTNASGTTSDRVWTAPVWFEAN